MRPPLEINGRRPSIQNPGLGIAPTHCALPFPLVENQSFRRSVVQGRTAPPSPSQSYRDERRPLRLPATTPIMSPQSSTTAPMANHLVRSEDASRSFSFLRDAISFRACSRVLRSARYAALRSRKSLAPAFRLSCSRRKRSSRWVLSRSAAASRSFSSEHAL